MGKKDDTDPQDKCAQLCKGVEVPSEEEMEALNALRSIKEKVRELKRLRAELSSSNESGDGIRVSELDKEMARLKKDWDGWEEKRKEAARKRMVMLGHESE